MLIGHLLMEQTQDNLLALDKNEVKVDGKEENIFSLLLSILKQNESCMPEKEKASESFLDEPVATLSALEILKKVFPQGTVNFSLEDTRLPSNWQQQSHNPNMNNGYSSELFSKEIIEIIQLNSKGNLDNAEIITKQGINVLPENLDSKLTNQDVSNSQLKVIDKFINEKQIVAKFKETSDKINNKITKEMANDVTNNLSSKLGQIQEKGLGLEKKIKEPFQATDNNHLNQETTAVEIIKKPLLKEVSAELGNKAESNELNTLFTVKKPTIQDANYFNSNDSKNFSSFLDKISNKSLNNTEPVLPIKTLPEFILKQLKTRIMTNKMENSSEINLRLQPEELGKLNLKLSYSEGQVSVKILTENSHVKELVEHNLLQLRESLNNQGIKCSGIDVQVKSDGSFQQYFGQSSNPFNQTPNYYKVKRGYQKLDDEMVVEDTKELLDNTNLPKSGLSNLEILA